MRVLRRATGSLCLRLDLPGMRLRDIRFSGATARTQHAIGVAVASTDQDAATHSHSSSSYAAADAWAVGHDVTDAPAVLVGVNSRCVPVKTESSAAVAFGVVLILRGTNRGLQPYMAHEMRAAAAFT